MNIYYTELRDVFYTPFVRNSKRQLVNFELVLSSHSLVPLKINLQFLEEIYLFLYLFILWLRVHETSFSVTRSFCWANLVNHNLPVSFCFRIDHYGEKIFGNFFILLQLLWMPKRFIWCQKFCTGKLKKDDCTFWKHDVHIFLLTSYWP